MLADYFVEYAESLTTLEECVRFRDFLRKRYTDYAYSDDVDEEIRIYLYNEFDYMDDKVQEML